MYIEYADAIFGLQYGDEGKGKIAAGIAQSTDHFLSARYNGGSNAGHSVHFKDKPTLYLHQIPTAVAYKKQGYIGPGCLVDFQRLKKEAVEFEKVMGFNPFEYLYISPKAICVTEKHKQRDRADQAINQGSTSAGVAPAYSDFYNRDVTLANEAMFTWNNRNLIREFKYLKTLLLEGAQGWYLNPYQGNYPYTTSSSSHPAAAAVSFGFPANKIRNVIGVAKCYETRSGFDPTFHHALLLDGTTTHVDSTPYDELYNEIVAVGNEYGVTTGRRRGIRFLDLTRLINAVNDSGTNILVIQKWDILQEVSLRYDNAFSYYMGGNIMTCDSCVNMVSNIREILGKNCPDLEKIMISSSPINDIDWSQHL